MERAILVKQAKKGNKDALVKLIMAQKHEYYKLAHVYVKNKDDALDAMEDMIVILYENIYKLKKEEVFYSWSKTILVNCCKKILKDKRKIVSIDNIEEKSYEGELKQKEDQILLEEHLGKLKESHREIIKLRYFLDLDYQSIANLLDIPLGTVKSRISIGMEKLKESLGGDGYERS